MFVLETPEGELPSCKALSHFGENASFPGGGSRSVVRLLILQCCLRGSHTRGTLWGEG